MSGILIRYIFLTLIGWLATQNLSAKPCSACFLDEPGDLWHWDSSRQTLSIRWNGTLKTWHGDSLRRFAKSYPAASNFEWMRFLTLNLKPSHPPKEKAAFRVLIDPGHWAANWADAKRESRYLLAISEGHAKPDTLMEAMLTLQTAYMLRHLLQEQGCEVQLTRPWPGSSLGMPFLEWFHNHRNLGLKTALENQLIDQKTAEKLSQTQRPDVWQRALFHQLDLWYRIEGCRHFNPDLVLSIHFNVGLDEPPTPRAFIPFPNPIIPWCLCLAPCILPKSNLP